MKKIYSLAILVVILIAVGIILANKESPDTNQNLLGYFLHHISTKECHIQNQEYKTETKLGYNEDCVRKICEEKHSGNSERVEGCLNSTGLGGTLNSFTFGECDQEVFEFQVPQYAELSGEQRREFYLGMPILKESCPSGYESL